MGGILDWLGITNDAGKDQMDRAQEAAAVQRQAAEEANKLYTEYMNRALGVQEKSLEEQKAAQLAAMLMQLGMSRNADVSYRQMLNAQQAQQNPYQTARLSALQSLPVLQKMAGNKAYRLPTDVTTVDFTSGTPDYQTMFRNYMDIINTMGTKAPATTTPTPTDAAGNPIPTNVRANILTPTTAPTSTPTTPAAPITGVVPQIQTEPRTVGGTTQPFRGQFDAQNLQALRDAGYTLDANTEIIPIQTQGWGGAPGGDNTMTSGYRTVWRNPNDPNAAPIQVTLKTNPLTMTGSYSDLGGNQGAVPYGDGGSLYSGATTPATPAAPSMTPAATTPDTTMDDLIKRIMDSGMLGTDGTAGQMTSTQTPLEEFEPEYNYEDSPLYQFRKKESEQAMGRALRARGMYGSETGAMITAKEQERIAAEEAENQYRRVADLVNIGLGGQASAGQIAQQAGSTLGSTYTGLGQDISNTMNTAAQTRSGLYGQQQQLLQQAGTGLAENVGQIGQAQANWTAAGYTPANPNNFLTTAAKLYGLYTGFGGGSTGGLGWGSGSSLAGASYPASPIGVGAGGVLTGFPAYPGLIG